MLAQDLRLRICALIPPIGPARRDAQDATFSASTMQPRCSVTTSHFQPPCCANPVPYPCSDAMEVDGYRSASDLVKRYFRQLTQGCGRRGCPNRNCFNCVDGPGRLDPTAAAVRSLELAKIAQEEGLGSETRLCEDEPPFLHLELVQELVAEATLENEVKSVIKEVAAVFSNSEALNRSFLQSDTQREQVRGTRQDGGTGKWDVGGHGGGGEATGGLGAGKRAERGWGAERGLPMPGVGREGD